MRPTIFHLGNPRVSIMRMDPIFVAGFVSEGSPGDSRERKFSLTASLLRRTIYYVRRNTNV